MLFSVVVYNTIPPSTIYSIAMAIVFISALLLTKWRDPGRVVAFAGIIVLSLIAAREVEGLRLPSVIQPPSVMQPQSAHGDGQPSNAESAQLGPCRLPSVDGEIVTQVQQQARPQDCGFFDKKPDWYLGTQERYDRIMPVHKRLMKRMSEIDGKPISTPSVSRSREHEGC